MAPGNKDKRQNGPIKFTANDFVVVKHPTHVRVSICKIGKLVVQ